MIQAVDGAGNVATASSKGPGFAPVPPPPAAPSDHARARRTAVRLVHRAADDHRWRYRRGERHGVDRRWRGPAVHRPVRAERALRRLARRRGRRRATARARACSFASTRARRRSPRRCRPPANVNGWRNSPVTATFTCGDSASGVADCPPPVSTGDQEGAALVLNGTATDRAGLTASASSTVKVDLTPPTAPQLTLDPASRPTTEATQIHAATTDALSGLAGGEWWIGDDPGTGEGAPMTITAGGLSGEVPASLAPGSYVVSVRSIDLAGSWSSIGMATLTVTPIPPVNRRPTATPATVTARSGKPVPIVLAGRDVDGDPLSFRIVARPAHGTLSGRPPAVTYTSTTGYTGADSFRFVVNDGQVDSPAATVAITVTAAPPPPPPAPVLSVANNSSRTSSVRPLHGVVFRSGASAYVFVGPLDESRLRSVTFTLDGDSFAHEREAPFDFAGTSSSRPCRSCLQNAHPFESNLLTVGTHRIRADVLMRDGSRKQLQATFTVAGTTSHRLLVSKSSWPHRGVAVGERHADRAALRVSRRGQRPHRRGAAHRVPHRRQDRERRLVGPVRRDRTHEAWKGASARHAADAQGLAPRVGNRGAQRRQHHRL